MLRCCTGPACEHVRVQLEYVQRTLGGGTDRMAQAAKFPLTFDLTPLKVYLDDVAPRGRTMLLPALHHAQSLYGWLPESVQREISFALRVPLADVHGVIEFYTMFYGEPTAKRVIRICEDPACTLAGAKEVMAAIEATTGLHHGESSPDGELTYEHVPCLGMCELAPCALDAEKPLGQLTPADVPAVLDRSYPEPAAQPYGETRWLLKRVGVVDPASMAEYRAHGGYEGLPKALSMSPEDLIAEVDRYGIVGRGGAMFPLGRKWTFTRGADGPAANKHIVLNADESEPGTFKDRCLMEEDPFSVIESMTIAGYAVGAENGWIFVRGEYPRSFKRLQHAVHAAREAGLLGENVMGKQGFTFDIEVRLGAGAYICGEETALFEAIEGKRGFPRIKPPYPPNSGLFYQPTSVNNVETLCAMLAALNVGADAWNNLGSAGSPGTKLFCLSGEVARPGIYELPFGLTLGEVIEMAGGVTDDRALKAILMGGAAGVFVAPDQLDMKLNYEDSRSRNIPLGSGVIMVFSETADLRQPMYELARFFAHESCGKCFPCQLGTQRQMEILDRIANQGEVKPGDKMALQDLGFAMTETSLCGLGQTAASAVVSAIDLWPELVE